MTCAYHDFVKVPKNIGITRFSEIMWYFLESNFPSKDIEPRLRRPC
jgi:hypothetical protein